MMRSRPGSFPALAVLPLAMAVAGCGAADPAADDSAAPSGDGVVVAAAFYPLQYLAEQIGGDGVTVVPLTPPGGEPHDLELTPDSLVTVSDADLLVYLAGFQPAVDAALAERTGPSVDVSTLATRVVAEGEHAEDEHAEDEHTEEKSSEEGPRSEGPSSEESSTEESGEAHADDEHAGDEHGEDEHGGNDPHFWNDPATYAQAADLVAEALAAADPGNGDVYLANAESLVAELTALDAEAETALANCTIQTLVTAHDAFGYFADRYGFEAVSIAGISPDTEPSAAELAAVTDVVRTEGVTTVYTETLVSPAVAETVADETGAATAVLDPLEGLTEESAGTDYPTVMRANIATVAEGQQCG